MKWLLSLFCKILLGLVLVVGLLALLFHAGSRTMTESEIVQWEKQRNRADALHPIQKQFAAELALLPGIEEARFLNEELLWVRFKPEIYDLKKDHVRVMCEGLAHRWAARAQMGRARVEARYGNEAYAVGTYLGPVPKADEGILPEVQPDGTLAMHCEHTPQEQVDELALTGLTLEEVETRHGPALTRHASTGWAFWPKFKAHFKNGVVSDCQPWKPITAGSPSQSVDN
jgi:hypothetical protein